MVIVVLRWAKSQVREAFLKEFQREFMKDLKILLLPLSNRKTHSSIMIAKEIKKDNKMLTYSSLQRRNPAMTYRHITFEQIAEVSQILIITRDIQMRIVCQGTSKAFIINLKVNR